MLTANRVRTETARSTTIHVGYQSSEPIPNGYSIFESDGTKLTILCHINGGGQGKVYAAKASNGTAKWAIKAARLGESGAQVIRNEI